jgi:hypothetical protein
MPLSEAARRIVDPDTTGKHRSPDVLMSRGLPGMDLPCLF